MTEIKLVLAPNKVLYKKAKEVDVENELPTIRDVCLKMVPIMVAFNGVGLAAPQVGVSKRFFIMKARGKDHRVCINPKIIRHGKEVKHLLEGCLSIPGLHGKTERHYVIDVEYHNGEGIVKDTLKSIEAQIFQHELAHLNGELCIETKATKEYMKQLEKKKESRIILPGR